MTNFEKIKAMSIEEMTKFLLKLGHCDYCSYMGHCPQSISDDCECSAKWKKWLESEAGEKETEKCEN